MDEDPNSDGDEDETANDIDEEVDGSYLADANTALCTLLQLSKS
jgi:hypothetical protein